MPNVLAGQLVGAWATALLRSARELRQRQFAFRVANRDADAQRQLPLALKHLRDAVVNKVRRRLRDA